MKTRVVRTALIALFLIVSLILPAQASPPRQGPLGDDAPPIELLARTFTPEPGLDAALRTGATAQANGRIHVLLQLWSVPGQSERAALEAAGIRLLSYIPHHAWLASVPAGIDLQASSLASVRWMGPIWPSDKISPAIRANGIGPWAVAKDGRVLLDLRFFDDVPAADALRVIARHGGEVQEDIGDFYRYQARFPPDAVHALAAEDVLMWVANGPPPKVALNDGVRSRTNVDPVQAGGLDGSNVDLGIWDGGDVDNHVDFSGRLTVVDSAGVDAHATHVAGTMAGDGSNSLNQGGTALQWRGMAPAADVISYDWDNSITDHNGAINTYGIELSQNSWGYVVEQADGNCFLYGNYVPDSRDYDDIVTGLYGKRIVVVFSCGNERDDGDCGMGGYPYINYANITPPGGTAKNVIVVGATNSNDDSMTDFSSWGPVDDGRIKPDVVAPGCESTGEGYIHSTLPGHTYGGPGWCGTSMAAPVVSGISALLTQQYRTTFAQDPLPSTIKALLVHTAVDLDDTTSYYNPGPDYASGYGRVDAQAAANAIVAQEIQEGMVSHSQTITHSMEVSPSIPSLQVTLVWDDEPASLLASPTLVNNLDLELVEPNGSTVYRPWVLDPSNPSAHATTGLDKVNNVEQVYVSNPTAGPWTVRVIGTSVPIGPQRYSLAGNVSSSAAPLTASLHLPLVLKGYPPSSGGWVTIVSEDFEGSFPGSWTLFDNQAGYGQYYWGKRNCRPYAGSYSGWALGGGANGAGLGCGSNYPDNASSWMVYGPFSLVGATAADLSFKLWLNSELDYDNLCQMASINGTNFYGSCISGNTAGWIDRTLDLTDVHTLGNLMGQPDVWVALVFDSDSFVNYTEGGYVDNILLRKYTSLSSGGEPPAGSSLQPSPHAGQFVERPATMIWQK